MEHCGANVSKQCTAALNCYAGKTLPVKYISTRSTQAVHGMHLHVAKTRFLTVLST